MRAFRKSSGTSVNIADYVRVASVFTCCMLSVVFFLSTPAKCAALPRVRTGFRSDSPLRDNSADDWAAAAAASAAAAMESAAAAAAAAHNAIAPVAPPGPPLLSPEKWRKRRSDAETKYSDDLRPADPSSEPSRFTPYVSVGVLSNLQSFFDVLRENLDSLEAMSPEDREALLREFKVADEVGGIAAPLQHMTPNASRAPHPPNATAQRPASTAAHLHAQRAGRPSPKTRQFVANSEPAFLRTTNLHDPGLLWVGLGRR